MTSSGAGRTWIVCFGLLVPMLVLLLGGCGGSGGQSSSATELLLSLSFDERSGPVAEDVSGNENDARALNGARWGRGQVGGGIELDGIDDAAAISASSSLNRLRRALTVSAWVQRSGRRPGWGLAVSRQLATDFDDQFYLGFHGSQPRFGVNTTSGGNEETGGSSVDPGGWVHLAGIYDGARMTLYVDGVAEASRKKNGAIRRSVRPVLVGAGGNAADALEVSETMRGRVDEVRVYARALTPVEVLELASGS